MTERLYYHDSFTREFDARVLRCEPAGAAHHVVLDRTLFYPTSGGQPFDTGALSDARVVEVVDAEDDAIVHVTDRAVAPGAVHGAIDWPRRFDHMQQHTGQHLLSAAFIELFGFPTVSFHLGRETSTIDLATKQLTAEQAAGAERRTNEIIGEDRAVHIRFHTAAELESLGVRKKVEREGPLRVIDIEGFDRQPCGGTHVARTGQVGMIQLRRFEKQRQNWRVEFVCGSRALRAARDDYAALSEAARTFGCTMAEVPAMVRKALDERKALERQASELWERAAAAEAASLDLSAGQGSGGAPRVISKVYAQEPAAFLRRVATLQAENPATVALLASSAGGHVVFARSADVTTDMNALLRETLTAFGGKGGGQPAFAQGTVPAGQPLEAVVQQAEKSLRR